MLKKGVVRRFPTTPLGYYNAINLSILTVILCATAEASCEDNLSTPYWIPAYIRVGTSVSLPVAINALNGISSTASLPVEPFNIIIPE